MSTTPPRILAIDPGTHYMGVAVLEGPALIHYAVKRFKEKRPAHEMLQATGEVLEQLIRNYRPTVLAYEKTFFTMAKASALLNVQEAEVKRVGAASGLQVFGYSPARVRKLLCHDGRATKVQVANVLAVRFPELAQYRTPGSRRLERYWCNMFDALAVGVVCSEADSSRG